MFKIFAFKGIFIVSMYILIVYCFLYLFKYQIYPYNNEKTIMKNTKISFDARFNFFFFKDILVVLLYNYGKDSFVLVNFVMINWSCKKNLIFLKISIKLFFNGEAK